MVRITTRALAAISASAIFGGVGVAMLAGWWETTSTKEPAKYAAGEFAGQANPADIRGSYTWTDIENAFGIPAGVSSAAFSTAGLAFGPEERVNALEGAFLGAVPEGREIGTDSVRLFVALYLGLPYEPEEGTALPDGAVTTLLGRPGLTPAMLAPYSLGAPAPQATAATASAPAPAAGVQGAAVAASPVAAGTALAAPATGAEPGAPAAGTAAPSGTPGSGQSAIASSDGTHVSPAYTITGKTTFGELYLWGLTKEQVKGAIGFEPGPVSQAVRDAVSAAGGSFSEIKAALQTLVDGVSR